MKFIPDPTFDIDDHIEFLTLVVPEGFSILPNNILIFRPDRSGSD